MLKTSILMLLYINSSIEFQRPGKINKSNFRLTHIIMAIKNNTLTSHSSINCFAMQLNSTLRRKLTGELYD